MQVYFRAEFVFGSEGCGWWNSSSFQEQNQRQARSLSGTAKSSRPRGSVRFMSTEQIFSRSASPPTPNRPGSQPRRPGMVLHLLMLRPFVQTSD